MQADLRTKIRTAEVLERLPRKTVTKRCSEVSQAYAGAREQGWRTLHYRFIDRNLASEQFFLIIYNLSARLLFLASVI